MTVLIGLTGPIGCGKSTVARWLGERPGVVVIDADEVAREVVEPGQPALEAIVERFGEGIRREDGTLDREALGRIVFADPVALRDLEAITHPAVRPRILAAIDSAKADAADAVVIEAIRLVEGGLAEICDEVWLVTCDPDVQRERLIGRGASADTAEQRIAAQSGLGERVRPVAARVLDTSGPPNRTKDEANAALDMALAT
ncbi:MAG: dephospho-CoA kinase [Chloroflexota bacterium]